MLQLVAVDNRQSTLRIVGGLVGESLREIAVLIVVFAPRDFFVQGKALTTRFVLITIVGVAIVFIVAVVLEVKCRWIR